MKITEYYNNLFYDNQVDGSYESAKEIVPFIMELTKPKNVIDIGCGLGTWLKEFDNLGVSDYIGVDGHHVDKNRLLISQDKFVCADIKLDFRSVTSRRFDLAVCLEVAEHLPLELAKGFIEKLVCFSDVILFSAAVPYQGGTYHINENWPYFWFKLFESIDYVPADIIRDRFWNNEKVCWWYRQNMFLFVKREKTHQYDAWVDMSKKINIYIHPSLFLLACNRARRPGDYVADSSYLNYMTSTYVNNNIMEMHNVIGYNKRCENLFKGSIARRFRRLLSIFSGKKNEY